MRKIPKNHKCKIQLAVDDELWFKFKRCCSSDKNLNEHLVYLIKEKVKGFENGSLKNA